MDIKNILAALERARQQYPKKSLVGLMVLEMVDTVCPDCMEGMVEDEGSILNYMNASISIDDGDFVTLNGVDLTADGDGFSKAVAELEKVCERALKRAN